MPHLLCSHELFHSWFGDTVTTPWWNEVYLQEGFARWFQYVVGPNSYFIHSCRLCSGFLLSLPVEALWPEFHIFKEDGTFGFFLFAYNAMWDTRDSFGGWTISNLRI